MNRVYFLFLLIFVALIIKSCSSTSKPVPITKEKINLPAKIINKANPIEAKIINFLIKFDIFLLDVFENQFNTKYKMTKITTDIKKKFIY